MLCKKSEWGKGRSWMGNVSKENLFAVIRDIIVCPYDRFFLIREKNCDEIEGESWELTE